MTIGRKVYYGGSNGIVIWDKGEMSDGRETTLDEDKQSMPILNLIPENELKVIQFNYGDYSDLNSCRGFIIDINTLQPIAAH